MELIFATGNPHKIKEAQEITGEGITLVSSEDTGITEEIPEYGETLSENALIKAEYVHKRCHKPCFADDTGLEVEALDGKPGVKSARYASKECDSLRNMKKLLKELEGNKNRKARFRTVIALVRDDNINYFEGILNGTIAHEASGKEGFGYDPLFIPEGYNKTLAELTAEEKNSISHRAKALSSLTDFLLKEKLISNKE
jgi:XTP/dITP diphosphohydrolase